MEFEMNLEQTLNEITGKLYGKNISACTDAQLYTGVLQLTKEKMAETPAITGDKKVYYISMEFLIGKLFACNIDDSKPIQLLRISSIAHVNEQRVV